MIVFCAVLSGIEDRVGLQDFAVEKEVWFRDFLELPNGIPSHATLSDVMGRLKPGAFAELMLRWVQVALPTLAAEQVCVDGKTLRGSGEGAAAVHLVSAYAARARRVLTQQAVAEKANEIVAIPDVLSLLELEGGGRDHRRHGLPESDCPTACRGRGRLCLGAERQPSEPLPVRESMAGHRSRQGGFTGLGNRGEGSRTPRNPPLPPQ